MSGVFARHRFGLLLGAILLSILVLPALGSGIPSGRLVGALVFTALLAAALNAAGRTRRAQSVLFVTAILAFVSAWMGFATDEGLPDLMRHVWSGLFWGLVAVLLLRIVLAPGRVTGERVTAAVCVYLILGLLWASAYSLLLLHDPTALRMPESAGAHGVIYFSFVTLTTLGYGDVAPVHPAARSLAFLEAAAGVLFVAVLVARLVALQVVHQTGAEDQRSSS